MSPSSLVMDLCTAVTLLTPSSLHVPECEFEVHYDSTEKLRAFQVTELPGHTTLYPYTPKEQLQRLFAIFFQWVVDGHYDLPYEQSLNAKFPDIKTLKAKEMLEHAWKGK